MSAVGGLKSGTAAATKALRASGVIVLVEPEEFFRVLHRQQQPPLVVQAVTSFMFVTHYQYLTSYRGLAFYTRSHTPLALPVDCEIVEAGSIWMPA